MPDTEMELVESLCAYVDLHGLEHEAHDCPEDDTCACPIRVRLWSALDAAIAALKAAA